MSRCGSLCCSAASLFFTLVLTVACAPSSSAQRSPVSATLLKQLGSAVDGYRINRPVWVVAAYAFPHEIFGVFTDTLTAGRVARDHPGSDAFGPYVAPLDAGGAQLMYATRPCPHYDPTIFKCGIDSLPGSAAAPSYEIDSMAVTVYARDRAPVRTTFRGDSVDAVFFTLSAIDRFVVPFYTQLFGATYAAGVRERAQRSMYRPAGR